MDQTPEAGEANAQDPGIAWLQENEAAYSEDPSIPLAEALRGDVPQEETSSERVAAALREGVAADKKGEAQKDTPLPGVKGGDGPSEGDDHASGSSEKKSPLYKKALAALNRGLQLPGDLKKTTIDAMSGEQVLEAGLAMAETQAEQDRVGSELGRMKAQDSNEDTDADSSLGATEPAEGSLDLSDILEPYDLDLNPEDLPEALTAVANAAVKQARGEVSKELSDLRAGFESYVVDQVGRQMEGRFPQLRDAESRAEVYKKMREIAPTVEYEKGDTLYRRTEKQMDLACQLALGTTAASQFNENHPGARSQPPRPSRRSPTQSASSGSQRDKDFAFLTTYEDTGGNLPAAKRAYSGN